MKRVLSNVFFVVYALIAVFVTICLLSFNEQKISEFGQYSLLIIDSNQLEPDYKKGELVLVNKKDSINVGDKIFFYNTYSPNLEISLAKVTNKENAKSIEPNYTLEGGATIASEYVIGPSNTTTSIPVVGSILGILESRWGFLFLIVFPSLVAFLYEIYVVVTEIRDGKKAEESK